MTKTQKTFENQFDPKVDERCRKKIYDLWAAFVSGAAEALRGCWGRRTAALSILRAASIIDLHLSFSNWEDTKRAWQTSASFFFFFFCHPSPLELGHRCCTGAEAECVRWELPKQTAVTAALSGGAAPSRGLQHSDGWRGRFQPAAAALACHRSRQNTHAPSHGWLCRHGNQWLIPPHHPKLLQGRETGEN